MRPDSKYVIYKSPQHYCIVTISFNYTFQTAIIATVSPSASSYEETISTLDYASRARDIKNTPTLNEKVTKTTMIQGLLIEIDRLQRDLDAARDKTGFYVHKENYQRLIDSVEAVTGEKLTMEELTRKQAKRIEDLEEIVQTKLKAFDNTVEMCKKKNEQLDVAKAVIKEKKAILKQERYVAQVYEAEASHLHKEAESLLTTTKVLSEEKGILHSKLEMHSHINFLNEVSARNTVTKILNMLEKISQDQAKLRASEKMSLQLDLIVPKRSLLNNKGLNDRK